MSSEAIERPVRVIAGAVVLEGDLRLPERARGVVLFAHGSGSSRRSSRNRYVAGLLNEAGLATLLIDLLTLEEERVDRQTAALRFDIDLLATRLIGATDWLTRYPDTRNLGLGYFGASTGAAAALVAAAERADIARAVVSRGGRPDLAGAALEKVQAPTLLIVGGDDVPVIELNRAALARLRVVRAPSRDGGGVAAPGAQCMSGAAGALDPTAADAADALGARARRPDPEPHSVSGPRGGEPSRGGAASSTFVPLSHQRPCRTPRYGTGMYSTDGRIRVGCGNSAMKS